MNSLVTVFTPSFNRKNELNGLYESLCAQTVKDFEWIIVDDGSSDGTEDFVKRFIQEEKIPIIYHYKKNEGKHIAINYGVSISKSKYFFIVDSDDTLVNDAIESIKYQDKLVEKHDLKIAGLGFLKSGNPIHIPKQYMTSLQIFNEGIKGDKAEVFLTNVIKKYPFPQFEGEKFMTEAVVWNRIANDGYYLIWTNKVIYNFEYLDGGLTKSFEKTIINNFNGYTLYINELLSYEINPKFKFIQICLYFGRGKKAGLSFTDLCYLIHLNPIKVWMCYIIGYIYIMYIR